MKKERTRDEGADTDSPRLRPENGMERVCFMQKEENGLPDCATE